MFLKFCLKHGLRINTSLDNATYSREGWKTFPTINVEPGQKWIALNSNGKQQTITNINYYNNNKEFLSNETIGSSSDLTIPENCYYIRFATTNDQDITQFKRTDVDNYSPNYEPYRFQSILITDNEFNPLLNKFNNFINNTFNLDYELINNSYIMPNGKEVSDDYSSIYSSSNFIKVIPRLFSNFRKYCN